MAYPMNSSTMPSGALVQSSRTVLMSAILAIGAILFSSAVLAQGKATVVVDRNPVVAGQAFRITFEFQNARVDFDVPPAIQGLRYVGGPFTSNSTQINNGAVTSKKSYAYSAMVMNPGLLRIPSFTFQVQGRELRTEPISLRVLSKGEARDNADAPFEAVIQVDKRKVHIGEPVLVQYKIFNRLDAVDVRNYTFPELSGVWKEAIEGEDPRWEMTIVDGKRVQVATVRSDILYPTRTGSLEIAGFEVQAQQRLSFFNTRPINANADAVSIEVTPLPASVPGQSLGTFEGLTVDWSMEDNAAPTLNEGLSIVLEFRGKGNLPMIGAPDIQWPDDLEVFDPEIKDRVTKDKNGQRGRRTMSYLVIPRAPGSFEVDLPEMGYFDHVLDRYVPLSAPAVQLDVAGLTDQEGPAFGFNSKTDVTILTRDMRFIKTRTELRPRSTPFYGGPIHLLLWAFPPLAFGIAMAVRARKVRTNRDPRLLRRKEAHRQLKSALEGARKGTLGLDELGNAGHFFVQAHLDIPRSDAGSARYREALSALDPNLEQEWLDILETLDRGRFAPGAPQPSDIANRLEAAAQSMERIKPTPTKPNGSSSLALLLGLFMLGQAALAAPNPSAATSTFEAGNTAYMEGDFESAIRSYEQIAETWTSFELEYNLGVAYYKSGQIGSSILHFERARRIRPSDDDLQANLLLARAAVVDRIEEMPEIALGPLWRELTSGHRLKGWTLFSLVSWSLAFLLFYLRMMASDTATRRTLILVAPALALIALTLGFMGRQTHQRSRADDGAVIIVSRIEVMSSPGDGDNRSKLFVLHEGTVVELLRSEGEWLQIRLANGNAGWIPSGSIVAI